MEEFAGADMGDARLNRRVVQLSATLADKPTASILVACGDRAAMQAVYRFRTRVFPNLDHLDVMRTLIAHGADVNGRRMRAIPH